MKIILPYIFYKYFINYEPHPEWILCELKSYKLIPLIMGDSFKSLLPYLKNQKKEKK